MVFSIQQLYRRNVLLLCAALMVLLTVSLTIASLLETRVSAMRELQSQANMIALQIADQKLTTSQELSAVLKSAAVNTSLETACMVSDREMIRASTQGLAYEPYAS